MKKIISLSLFAALFCACSSQEEVAISKTNPSELNVAVNIGELKTRTFTDEFAANSKIGILITDDAANTPKAYTPKSGAYTYNDATKFWDAPALSTDKLILNNSKAVVYGFYPSDATLVTPLANDATNKLVVDLPANINFDESNTLDYMYATVNPATLTAPFPQNVVSNKLNENKADMFFHHALTKVSFIINKSESYRLLGKLTEIKFVNPADVFMTGSSKMLLADGTFSEGTIGKEIKLSGTAIDVNPYDKTTPATKVLVKGLITPVSDLTNTKFELTVDNQTLSGTLPLTGGGDKWLPGYSYLYTITIKDNSVNVDTVTIIKWEPDIKIDTEANY